MKTQVTFQDAEIALTAGTPATVIAANAAVSAAMIFNKDASAVIYVTDDGSAPSDTHGFPIAPGTGYEYPAGALPDNPVQVFSTGAARVFSRWA